jgi:hypothetical protein
LQRRLGNEVRDADFEIESANAFNLAPEPNLRAEQRPQSGPAGYP